MHSNSSFQFLAAACLSFVLCLRVVLPGVADEPELHNPALQSHSEHTVKLSDKATLRIEKMIAQAIDRKEFPGCVVCVGRGDRILHLQAYGNKRLLPEVEVMETDTVFDMASITKPVATGTSIMKLIEQGKLSLNTRVSSIFPDFGVREKESITVLDLLVHRSGLIPDNAMADYLDGPEIAWTKILDLPLTAPIGKSFKYSDVNFIVLGKIVEELSGMDLNAFSRTEIFEPTGMTESGFLPSEPLRARAAPTQLRNDMWMLGEVHDPRAHALGGIAGHAGLFSTARDMAKYAQMVLNRGIVAKNDEVHRVFAPATLELMGRGVTVPGGIRGLSWDKQTGFSSNKGDLLSDAAIGHGGFTGTVLWIDPKQDLFFVFLSNRVHPDGNGAVNQLAGKLINVVVGDVAAKCSSRVIGGVHSGLDSLKRDDFRQIVGKKVGLIANHTANTSEGEGIVPLFVKQDQFQLTTLFSPEHGFEGKLDIEKIDDSQDAESGIKIYSLYGETRRPTEVMLSDVDVLVFDIQDIGTRFYTYISTMGEAMRAAEEYKKKFVVLDRPNPINGVDTAGPMLDSGKESFVSYHDLPLRHGMTVGEIARMLKEELRLELELEVVPCEGWKRDMYFDATGLSWINPSPNMRSLQEAILYPGIGLLEMTNISVGRGTDSPFEWIGAPWMNGRELASRMNDAGLSGVVFIPVTFTPASSKHANSICQGVRIEIVDRESFKPVDVGLRFAWELRRLHSADWETKGLDTLLRCQELESAILEGAAWEDIVGISRKRLRDFRERRIPYLLY